MSTVDPAVLADADVAYVRGGFVALHELCAKHDRGVELVRAEIASDRLPEASYILGDGTEWGAYLSGLYGVCLNRVTPETIVRKSALVAELETLLGRPEPDDPRWASDLRIRVDELDALERPFAPAYDRLRFGGPSSRDLLVTAPRREYPEVFAAKAVRQ